MFKVHKNLKAKDTKSRAKFKEKQAFKGILFQELFRLSAISTRKAWDAAAIRAKKNQSSD